MNERVIGALFGALALLASPAQAASVLDEVKETGRLVAGTRPDSRPFAWRDEAGQFAGFSVDILKEIARELSTRLGRPVELELKAVTPQTRIGMVQRREIAIECGITGPTWARQEAVEFSIPFYVNGARVLASRKLGQKLDSLAGRKIGVVAGATEKLAVMKAVPTAEIVEVPDMTTGMRLFEAGEIDGLANLGIVLRSLIDKSSRKGDLLLLPRDDALLYEPIACMLPHDDTRWRAVVDAAIAKSLDGAEAYAGRYVEIYNDWFGPGSEMPVPLDQEVIGRLRNAAFWMN
ncbi:MAG: amino acid ABC transporter substrate-binding protein [Alphaproteobacteria bacterium]|nr:amino acid ABC transporter substrate-binding protein [Alphaproteobacteria bacterium]